MSPDDFSPLAQRGCKRKRSVSSIIGSDSDDDVFMMEIEDILEKSKAVQPLNETTTVGETGSPISSSCKAISSKEVKAGSKFFFEDKKLDESNKGDAIKELQYLSGSTFEGIFGSDGEIV